MSFYSRQTWQDGVSGNTPITAHSLNHMETGIKDAHDKLLVKEGARTATTGPLWKTVFSGTLTTAIANIIEHRIGNVMVSWFNEWGALRGRNPFGSYADALVRAVIEQGDYTGLAGTGGNAFEVVDRRLPDDVYRQLWGVRWATGNTIRNGVEVSDVYVTTNMNDPNIARLPSGTVIMVYSGS